MNKKENLIIQNHLDEARERLENISYAMEENVFVRQMKEPNQPFEIFEGEYILKSKKKEWKINGKIWFEWLPNNGVYFSGDMNNSLIAPIFEGHNLKLYLDNEYLGEGFIISSEIKTGGKFKGIVNQGAVFGNPEIKVNKIKFCIPNLRPIRGELTEKVEKNEIHDVRNRLILKDGMYNIKIEYRNDYDNYKKKLKEKGGFLFLYYGEIELFHDYKNLEEIHDLFFCLSTFLTFINGQSTAVMFPQGYQDETLIWTYYRKKTIKQNRWGISWAGNNLLAKDINHIWKKFRELWVKPDSGDFLTSIISWYSDANSQNEGYITGPIILAQACMELLYNWAIEKGKLGLTKNKEKNAHGKIRKIVQHLNIDVSEPKSFANLQNYLEEDNDAYDTPKAITQVRNAFVHSDVKRIQNLQRYSPWLRYEVLQVFLWYIELAMLKILDYRGLYYNRCPEESNGSKTRQKLPWKS